MRLSERIRVARRKAGLSQQQLAVELRVNRSAVANWECAEGTKITSNNLIQIATTTEVSFDWLATGRGAMRWQTHPDEIPALDADIVDDPAERRLLRAYRAAPDLLQMLLLDVAETFARSPPPYASLPHRRDRQRLLAVEDQRRSGQPSKKEQP